MTTNSTIAMMIAETASAASMDTMMIVLVFIDLYTQNFRHPLPCFPVYWD